MDKLGERIYALRSRDGMSQGALADAINVSRQAVSKWENGMGMPTPENIVAMSVLFCVTTDYILIGKVNDAAPEETHKEEPRADEGFSKRKLAQIIGIVLISFAFLLVIASLLFFVEFMIFAVYMAVTGGICLAAKNGYAEKILFFSAVYGIVIWIMMLALNAY